MKSDLTAANDLTKSTARLKHIISPVPSYSNTLLVKEVSLTHFI